MLVHSAYIKIMLALLKTHENKYYHMYVHTHTRGPFERFVDWRQCAVVMQTDVVTVMTSCSGGGNVVVA